MATLVLGALGGWLLPLAVAYIGWTSVLVSASVIDLRDHRLPRALIEPALVAGVAWLLAAGVVHDRTKPARNALVGLACSWPFSLASRIFWRPKSAFFGEVRFGAVDRSVHRLAVDLGRASRVAAGLVRRGWSAS